MKLRALLAVLSILVLSIASVAIYVGWHAESRLHAYIVNLLATSLESEVELGSATITWFPPRVRAQQLTVRHHGRRDVPPLIVLASFTANLSLSNLWNRVVDHVDVEGLEISIPPRVGTAPRLPHPKGDGPRGGPRLFIRMLTAQNARVALIPGNQAKNPKVWDVDTLVLHDIAPYHPATFEANLINPIPYGLIASTGTFGPWDADEPGQTSLGGLYTFSAELDTIKGIAGHVDATGTMQGILERIETHGLTSTDEFRLTALHARSLPLKTTYDAVVDGTDGDVELTSVAITLGHSTLHARGKIEGATGIKGKRVVLNVTSQALDLAETLNLVMTSRQAPARGTLIVDAALDLPPGAADVIERLELAGSIRAESLRFTNDNVQDQVDTLSRRGQGRPTDFSIDAMPSKAVSKFTLSRGRLRFTNFTFQVEGATVDLNGTYALRSNALDFEGTVSLKASASQTLTGFKTWLLKPFDPLFRKRGAGAVLSMHVLGTADKPDVGFDLKKTLTSK